MAEVDEAPFSLLSLEDELTCSICLSPFHCPVTIPCGHNFCQDCLLATWRDSYSCPQCRTQFPTRPELKKNTVLSTVVETFSLRLNRSDTDMLGDEKKKKEKEVVRCDTCMEAEASRTCLTCMASFCEEHLRPHRENPIFRVHQLSEPVGDLSERICPDHHRMMELFCTDHGRLICSLCLQVHKGCSFMSPEEQRSLKESELRDKMGVLDGKIEKTETVMLKVKEMQSSLKDGASKRKEGLAAVYQQMRDVLAQGEREAQVEVDHELEVGQTKLRDLMKRLTDNTETMRKAREDLSSLLSQSHTPAFLQASFDLPKVTKSEPHIPRINLDSKKVMATETFANALKELLTEMFKKPVEDRLPIIKPGEKAASGFATWSPESYQESETEWPSGNPGLTTSHSPGPASQPKIGPKKKRQKRTKKTPQPTEDKMGNKNIAHVTAHSSASCVVETSDIPPNITSHEKRNELLKYGTVLTFDPKTAHKRITLSEDFTKATVSDEHTNYPDFPERFTVCSQVLTTRGFSRGRHYWEVRLSSNNFVGIGLAYSSMDRKGPTSRLGRNAQSWCVEWFNGKLSAWLNSSETVLVNPSPKRVGVLLDCEEGTATFYNVSDRAYPFHSFVYPFAAAVYPAFWIFSSGSSISLCKLQA